MHPLMRRAAIVGLMLLLTVFGCAAFGLIIAAWGAPDSGALERAAADSATTVQNCTCVEGPLAVEIEKLRTQIRLLKAEARVNEGIACAKHRTKK